MVHKRQNAGRCGAPLLIMLALFGAGCGGDGSSSSSADADIGPAPSDRLRTVLTQAGDSGAVVQLVEGDTLRISESTLSFYRRLRFTPAWSVNGEPTRQAHAVHEAIGRAHADGLEPAAYAHDLAERVLALLQAEDEDGDPAVADSLRGAFLADLDLVLSEGYMRFATDIARGTIDPELVGRAWRIPRPDAPTEAVLRSAVRGDPAQIVERMRPTSTQYARLMTGLAKLRQVQQAGGWQALPEGTAVAEGDSSSAVLAVRARLVASDDPREAALARRGESRPAVYDRDLHDALRHFQARHALADDGQLGGATLQELNHTAEERISEVRLNLDRWRWLPRDLGELYIMVNIAGFELEVVENNRPIEAMNVVVGMPGWTTPVFADTMEHLVVNPYWTPPESILKDEILPAIARDPGYLERNNFERTSNGTIRQRPGRGNALGDYKFIFPNEDNIYLHDTPADHLFSRTRRDFSHGCIRVERPADLARLVLAKSTSHSPASLEGIRATGTEKWIPLKRQIPVYIVYFTTWAKEDGTLRFHHDVYGHDRDLDDVHGEWTDPRADRVAVGAPADR
ncbi:L,D-transpeptidase family protein [soil metagenome]